MGEPGLLPAGLVGDGELCFMENQRQKLIDSGLWFALGFFFTIGLVAFLKALWEVV